MKVFIITKEPFPNGMAATKRIKCYAKGLAAAGVTSEVIIAKRTEIYGQRPNNIKSEGILDDYIYKYIGGTPLRGSNVIIRKINDIIDEYKMCQYIIRKVRPGDVILNYLREDPLNQRIIKVANKIGIKVVRDLCEYPYGTGKETFFIKYIRKYFMKNVFSRFDGVIAISQFLFDYAMLYKSDSAKLIKIPILVDDTVNKLSDKFVSDVPYIFHSGTLYEQKDGIIGAIEAFIIATKKLPFKIKYILTGYLENSPEKNRIKSIIENNNMSDSIKFVGFLSNEDLNKYQNGCTMMIINKNANQQNTYCFATKLGEYLLSGKPVLTTNIGEAKHYLTDGKNAYMVDPEDVETMADRIVEIFENVQRAMMIGENGRQVALDNFIYSVQGKRLKNFFESLYNGV